MRGWGGRSGVVPAARVKNMQTHTHTYEAKLTRSPSGRQIFTLRKVCLLVYVIKNYAGNALFGLAVPSGFVDVEKQAEHHPGTPAVFAQSLRSEPDLAANSRPVSQFDAVLHFDEWPDIKCNPIYIINQATYHWTFESRGRCPLISVSPTLIARLAANNRSPLQRLASGSDSLRPSAGDSSQSGSIRGSRRRLSPSRAL